MKYGRKSLSCEELAADVRPTSRIMRQAGERWERRMSERGLGKRMLCLDVIYDSGRRKTQTYSPFCMWTRKKSAVSSAGLRNRAIPEKEL